MGNLAKKPSKQKAFYTLIKQLTGQHNVLTIQKVFIDLTGSINAAIFLSQLLYWSDKGADPDGWIYKTHDEWHDEIRLSPYQVRGVTKTLVEMGILETKFEKVGNTPKLHYRLVGDEFTASTMKFLDSQQSRNLTVLDNEVSSPSCLTEITIDHDTEIKNLTSTPSAQKPEAAVTPKPKPTPKHKQEPQERPNTDLSEVTYCEAGDEFGDLTEKQKPAKWMLPNTPLAERALNACGRLYYIKGEKTTWVTIERAALSMASGMTSEYPMEWIENRIEIAENMNGRKRHQKPFSGGVKMTFPNLLKAITNVSKKTDWVAKAEENRPVRTMNYAEEDGVGKYSLRSGDEQLAELENNAKNKYAQDEVEFEKFIEREAAARRKKYV